MTQDFDEINQILKDHFKTVTPEEFKKNLQEACPYLHEDTSVSDEKYEISDRPSLSNMKGTDNPPEIEEINQILKQHFLTVTPDEFRANLKEASPEIYKIVNFSEQPFELSSYTSESEAILESKSTHLARRNRLIAGVVIVVVTVGGVGVLLMDTNASIELSNSILHLIRR
jgi:hypothetical protein